MIAQISQVYFMTNGMVVVFDGKDQQVPELQGHYNSVKVKLWQALSKQVYRPTFYDQNAFERMQRETLAPASVKMRKGKS